MLRQVAGMASLHDSSHALAQWHKGCALDGLVSND